MNSENRKCKKCNIVKILQNDFYKTGNKKKNGDLSYQYTCKNCYCKRQLDNADKNIKYYENDFDDLPTEIKIKLFKLSLENTNIKAIARDVKCKYNMLWYAIQSKQIQKFGDKFYREHLQQKNNQLIIN